MAIQNRRGYEADFDPAKMLPGEWAVSLDTKYVRMCFAPGECLRMATYEGFEQDMEEVRRILAECQDIQTAIEQIQNNISDTELVIENYVSEAKKYRDEAKQFRDEAETFAPEGYADLVQTVADNTVKIDTVIEKAELNIKNTASGENIHVTDSADSKVIEFGLHGKAEQKQYSGKNLLENTATSRTVNGLTVTVNEDKSITVNGTSTAQTTIELKALNAEGVAKLNGYKLSGGTSICRLYIESNTTFKIYGQSAGSEGVINVTAEEGVTIFCRISAGKTVNETFYPMISQEGGEYEPFVGNAPSPSPEYPQDIEVAGESYNELEITIDSQTINGGTVTVNEDKSITVNGTFTAETTLILNRVALKANNSYILSGCPSGGSITTYRLLFQESSLGYAQDTGNGANVTPTEDIDSARITLQIFSGTVNNLTFYPMLRKASVKNDRYMPYGVGSIEVKSVGKNLWKFGDVSGTLNSGKDVDYEAGEYTISALVTSNDTDSTTSLMYIGYENGSFEYLYFARNTRQSHTITFPNRVVRISLYASADYGQSSGDTFKWSDIQIEEGSVATPYQPYTETTSLISTPEGFPGIPVDSGGNYTDENGQEWISNSIYKYADGSGKRIQRIGKAVFDGSDDEGWALIGSYDRIYTTILQNVIKKVSSSSEIANVLCSAFVPNAQATINEGNIAITNLGHVVVRTALYATNINLWTAYLAENPMTVLYELATPIITDLTAEEIAEIEKMHTFYPVTNISNDANCNMAFKYLCDSKNYIDNKFALIEAAMVNNI